MPAPELQSTASWMWKPTSLFGFSPVTLALTRTLAPRCSKLTVPRTLLPLVNSSLAVALGPPPPVRLDQVSWTVWQPASSATAAIGRTAGLIGWLLKGGPLYSLLRLRGRRLGRRHGNALVLLVVRHGLV